jgi:GNAT superfamily N-acetyltransferase
LAERHDDEPLRLHPGDPRLAGVLALIRAEFAYMDGRVDPPSSVHRMTAASLEETAAAAEVWAVGAPPLACVILTPRPDALYLGKLAVTASARRRGLARRLIGLAEARAQALGLGWLELQVRVELAENHAAFAALGFRQTGASAHPGFDRPTSLTLRRQVIARPGR